MIMIRLLQQWYLLVPLFLFASCVKEERLENTPIGNFEELWRTIDERYCFFEYKEIDWEKIYYEYKSHIHPGLSDYDLFLLLGDMLNELRDGHVNLYSDTLMSQYTAWYSSYPENFNEVVLFGGYLTNRYIKNGSLLYTILDDNIGYIHCESFSETITNEDLNSILKSMSACRGLIVDVRNNSGGSIGNSTILASHFTNTSTLTGYIRHKTGQGHNDFSEPNAIYTKPSNGVYWSKPVAVLTNRRTYSAGNYFVNNMRCFPNVFTVGDVTGGGSGLPFTSELPNGWGVRFSSSPHFDLNMNHIEFGIEPDYKVNMDSKEEEEGIDSIIEKARFLLNNPTLVLK